MIFKSVLLEFTNRKEFEKKISECHTSTILKPIYISHNKAVFLNLEKDSDIHSLQLQMLKI